MMIDFILSKGKKMPYHSQERRLWPFSFVVVVVARPMTTMVNSITYSNMSLVGLFTSLKIDTNYEQERDRERISDCVCERVCPSHCHVLLLLLR